MLLRLAEPRLWALNNPDMFWCVRSLALIATLSCCAVTAQSPDRWTLVQDGHFEVYSHTGDDTAQQALIWFEQLRTFFQQNGLLGAGVKDEGRPRLQVIGFRSEKEYEEYRLGPVADAYYVADGSRSYIIMASLEKKDYGVAAHEYTHDVLHASDVKLPAA